MRLRKLQSHDPCPQKRGLLHELQHLQIVEKAYDRKYGARPLRRKLQEEVEDRLAEEIIQGRLQAGDKAIVTTKNKELVVTKG